MVITALLENTTLSKDYESKHGLCLHIKTKNHNILFDVGPDGTFIKNAEKLNIDISDVDIVVISHGHKDHGGGLVDFLNYNSKAKIYINKNAFDYYHASVLKYFKPYIGLEASLAQDKRVVLVDDNFKIDEEILLFSGIKEKKLISSSNKLLLKKEEEKYVEDKFNHEQNLILREDNKNILFSGCGHNGITNIIEKAEKVSGKSMDTVIGGFHLFDPIFKKSESVQLIENIGEILVKKKANFYTCHCTGVKPFKILKQKLEDKMNYVSTGQVIEV